MARRFYPERTTSRPSIRLRLKLPTPRRNPLRVDITQYPTIACYTPNGECFAIWGNIPFDVTARVSLAPGKHAIAVQRFNAGGGRSQTVTTSKNQSFDSDINNLYKNALKYCPSHYGVALDYALRLDKVDRVPEFKKDCFHLGKILIYGKPLY